MNLKIEKSLLVINVFPLSRSKLIEFDFRWTKENSTKFPFKDGYRIRITCFNMKKKNFEWPSSVMIRLNNNTISSSTSDINVYVESFIEIGLNHFYFNLKEEQRDPYIIWINMVRINPFDKILPIIKKENSITMKDSIWFLKSTFSCLELKDEDFLSSLMKKLSLKCPISLSRIKIPVRGKHCKHVQCFDLRSFVEENTWICPCCNSILDLRMLIVDPFYLVIVSKDIFPFE